MRPALVSKSGSRGKIQQRCCQGRMASSFSHRQMVVSLREAVNPQARTWEPRSATLPRESGSPTGAGHSQAMALTRTTSSGGENPGSAGAGDGIQAAPALFFKPDGTEAVERAGRYTA